MSVLVCNHKIKKKQSIYKKQDKTKQKTHRIKNKDKQPNRN